VPLRAELDPLRAERDLLKRELATIRFAEGPFGIIVRKNGTRATSLVGGRQYQTLTLPDGSDVELGDAVRFAKTEKGLALVETIKQPIEGCPIVVVSSVLPGRRFECTFGGASRTCRFGRLEKVTPGDRVVVDPDVQIGLSSLGPLTPPQPVVAPVEWEDIGGLEDVKRELREAIEDPIVHRDLYRAFKLKPPRGILLAGPPGGGKTLLARAAATALSRLHGGKTTGFFSITGPTEILHKFVGESERAIRNIFDACRTHHKEHGYPAILFIDEADALFFKRGDGPWDGLARTIVPAFLTEMDGLATSAHAPLVILATNRPDVLDPALVRPGRIDRHIEIPYPDVAAARRIVEIHLKGRPAEDGLVDAIVDAAPKPVSGAVLESRVELIVKRALNRAKLGGEHKLLLQDVIEPDRKD
jgi:AAA+ superfamily predicted ATPase